MEKILRKVGRALLFQGDKIYLPTVLLFWYFASALIWMPFLETLPVGSAAAALKYLSFAYLVVFVAIHSPLYPILNTLGVVDSQRWWVEPNLPGLLIIFSLFFFAAFVINFILGNILLSLFKVRSEKGGKKVS